MNMSKNAKMIVITGVSKGLGRALVEGFAALGHTIVGCARASSSFDHLTASQEASHDFSVVDVSSDEQVRNWASRIIADFGVPDLLINNAAVINQNAKLWQIDAEEFDRSMAINVSGTANVIRHFVPAMVKRRKGVIVNLSSGWGRSVSAEVAPYCATKWAIEGLTRALAEELPDGMCAVPLNPGIINTEMLQSCFASGAEHYPKPDEWARRAIPFLLQLGPQHNGQPLTVPED
ncbi:MAG: SDR family oxidoreductase [Planctomycetaceae bacterium]|nr:SDR family oxidoreductase [Planctomycetaceae bacterium]